MSRYYKSVFMKKYPLSTAGLADLLAQLYALPDAALLKESASITANFRSWLNDNFELAATQLDFLDQIDNAFIAKAAASSAQFVQNRLPIQLIKANSTTTRLAETQDKVVIVHESTTKKFTTLEGYSEEAVLTFHINYQ